MKEKNWFQSVKEKWLPEVWKDKALLTHEKASRYDQIVKKGLPPTFFIEAGGYRNYSQEPGFSIIDPSRFSSLIYGGYASHNFVELFHCVPEIFAPIHAIASRIANADFQLRKWYNDEIVYNNKDWNRLYETPNPLQHFRTILFHTGVVG